MGLDVSHDAFSGAYSAFNRFRGAVAKAVDGSYPPHDDPEKDDDRFYVPGSWEEFLVKQPGISAFLLSNDFEGSFSPKVAKQMADEIESILPKLDAIPLDASYNHISREGGMGAVARKYIAGCRLAHKSKQRLKYL